MKSSAEPFHTETIVAIATGPGEGAIGIVRLSGPSARSLAGLMFRVGRGGEGGELTPYRLTFGRLSEPRTGRAIDEVMTVFMPGPYPICSHSSSPTRGFRWPRSKHSGTGAHLARGLTSQIS